MIFNPNVIVDRATYQKPTESPNGMTHVLVNGIPVVKKRVCSGRSVTWNGNPFIRSLITLDIYNSINSINREKYI